MLILSIKLYAIYIFIIEFFINNVDESHETSTTNARLIVCYIKSFYNFKCVCIFWFE